MLALLGAAAAVASIHRGFASTHVGFAPTAGFTRGFASTHVGFTRSPPPRCATTTHATPLSVFIEDTDCFAVVFYGNYLRFFERGALDAVGLAAVGTALRDDGVLFGIHSADQLKWGVPAVLGDECDVFTTPLGLDSAGRLAVRCSLVRRADGQELASVGDMRIGGFDAATGAPCATWPLPGIEQLVAGVEAEVGAGVDATPLPSPPAAGSSPPLSLPTADPSGSGLPAGLPRLQLDEASAAGGVSLHTALRYFERHRTTYIGGPAALAELQASGVNVVVGRGRRARLLPAAHRVAVGAALEVRARVRLRARNTQVIFEQWLLDGETGEPLATADITCLCIDPIKGRMVGAPEPLLARLVAAGAEA